MYSNYTSYIIHICILGDTFEKGKEVRNLEVGMGKKGKTRRVKWEEKRKMDHYLGIIRFW